MAHGWDGVQTVGMPVTPSLLTVSDIERMARAGVKIEMEDIKDQVIPDPPKKDIIFGQVDENGWMRAFLQRWDRAQPVEPMVHRDFEHVSICRGTKDFHVFVVLINGVAAHLTDPPEAFPSEALIAKVFMLKKEGKAGEHTRG